jgi:hypothetical protein
MAFSLGLAFFFLAYVSSQEDLEYYLCISNTGRELGMAILKQAVFSSGLRI